MNVMKFARTRKHEYPDSKTLLGIHHNGDVQTHAEVSSYFRRSGMKRRPLNYPEWVGYNSY